MKNILILLLLMISTNVLAEWTRVTGNDNGSSYVDFGTIKKKGRKVKMWILYDFKTIQKIKSYRYLSLLVPGKMFHCKASPEDIAQQTLTQLRRSVPAAMPGINFLSGGQTPEEATANLNVINVMAGNAPWELSFSYGRALQQPVLHAWQGKTENTLVAQHALLKRIRLNGAARYGHYSTVMEN